MASFTGYEPKNFVLRDNGQDFGEIVDETSSSENRFATLTLAGGNPIARQMSVTARANAEQLNLNSISNEILVPWERDSLEQEFSNMFAGLAFTLPLDIAFLPKNRVPA